MRQIGRREFFGALLGAIPIIGLIAKSRSRPALIHEDWVDKILPISISDLIIDEGYNCRNVQADCVSDLAMSIQEMGLLNPITVNRDFRVITGFRRVRACKQLGHKTILCKVVNGPIDPFPLNVNYCRELYEGRI